MFFKKERNNNSNQNINQNPFQENFNTNMLYPNMNMQSGHNYEQDRLIYEIKENRRRINNLAKRIVRLENYLRIRDTSDYSILDEEEKSLNNRI